MSPARPTLAQTTKLVARALGITPEQLHASLRRATQSDLPVMLALRKRVLGNYLNWDDTAYLNWRYRLGRDGAGQGDIWLVTHQGRLLAMVGTEDLRAHWRSHDWSVLSCMDIMVEPDLGDIGLGAWLNLVLQNQGADLVLAIGSNPRSLGMVRRLFDALPNRRSWVYPLRMDHWLAKRMPSKILAEMVAKVAQGVLGTSRRLLLRPVRKPHRVESVSALTPAWTKALNALLARSLNPEQLHLQRSAAYLDWRVLRNPKGAGELWGIWRDSQHDGQHGGQLLAYVATHSQAIDNRQALVISDVCIDQTAEAKQAWRQLLRAVLDKAQSTGHAYAIVTSYRHDVDAEFQRIGARQSVNEYETLSYTCSERVRLHMPEPPLDWTLNDIHTDRV